MCYRQRVCTRHLALSYKPGTEQHRNSDVAISHSSPFSLLVNKPKAARVLYSRPGLSSGAHMKALWLCFALACFQRQTASGLPKHIPQTPALGGEPAGSHAAHSPRLAHAPAGPLCRARPSGCLPGQGRPLSDCTIRSDQGQALLRACFAGERRRGPAWAGGYAPHACFRAAWAPGKGGTHSQSCLFESRCQSFGLPTTPTSFCG